MKKSILGFLGSTLLLTGCFRSPSQVTIEDVHITATPAVVGHDTLALNYGKFDTDKAARYFNPGSALGVLDNTFSSNVSNSRRLIASIRPSFFRVHLINGPCIRNGNCGPYEIGYGYSMASFSKALEDRNPKILKYIRERTAIWRSVAAESPGTRFLISPELEHDLSKAAFRVAADTVRAVWSDVGLVNSPDGSIAYERYLGAWLENHGTNFQLDSDIVSMDGAEGTDISINAWNKRVAQSPRLKIAYVWSRVYNCRDQAEHFTDPRKRNSCPGASQFELLSHLVEPRPAPPRFVGVGFTIRPFTGGQIWKPFAEDSGTGDPRANTPVAIVYPNGASLRALDFNGKGVGRLGYYSGYPPNYRRYYSNYKGGSSFGGYGFEKAAIIKSGSPWVWLCVGKTCTGPLITGQRQGTFR